MKTIAANLVSDALEGLPELADAVAGLSLATTVERTRDSSPNAEGSGSSRTASSAARAAPFRSLRSRSTIPST